MSEMPLPTRDLPRGRHDLVKEIVMGSIHTRPTRRIRRRTLVLAASLAVLLLATTAVQAARNGLTLKDFLDDPALVLQWKGSNQESAGQLFPDLELAPDEIDDAITRLSADIELPPGGDWEKTRATFRENPGYYDELGLRSTLESTAGYQWMCYWIENTEARNAAAVDAATERLSVVWKSPVLDAVDGGGTIDHWQRVAEAAETGDLETMWQLGTHCDPDAPPPGV